MFGRAPSARCKPARRDDRHPDSKPVFLSNLPPRPSSAARIRAWAGDNALRLSSGFAFLHTQMAATASSALLAPPANDFDYCPRRGSVQTSTRPTYAGPQPLYQKLVSSRGSSPRSARRLVTLAPSSSDSASATTCIPSGDYQRRCDTITRPGAGSSANSRRSGRFPTASSRCSRPCSGISTTMSVSLIVYHELP